jgi:hypothetical protein
MNRENIEAALKVQSVDRLDQIPGKIVDLLGALKRDYALMSTPSRRTDFKIPSFRFLLCSLSNCL